MTTSADKVLQYLEEIHALELSLGTTLTAHITMTPRSEYRDLLERHRYETRTQTQRIERRMAELGRSSSLLHLVYGTAQGIVGQGVALAMAPLSLLRGTGGEEKLLKNAKDEAASEALEIASYDALAAVAVAVGDEKTAVLAREHRSQEEQFLRELREQIPALAGAVIDAEVEGHPHYDPATTGAADAAREVVGRAKVTARSARKPTQASEGRAATPAADGTVAKARETPAALPQELPIDGYDELTVDQVLPKLKTLSAEELAAVDGHERGEKARKRVLDRIAALRTKAVDAELAQL